MIWIISGVAAVYLYLLVTEAAAAYGRNAAYNRHDEKLTLLETQIRLNGFTEGSFIEEEIIEEVIDG